MKYHFKTHKEKSGFWAECLELKGCQTQGDTQEELIANMSEALNLYLDEPENSKMVFPVPDARIHGRNIVEVPVEPKIAWTVLLRNTRLSHKMTQKDVAQALKIKSVYAYQKLESSKTANPALSTIVRVKSVFPELNLADVV